MVAHIRTFQLATTIGLLALWSGFAAAGPGDAEYAAGDYSKALRMFLSREADEPNNSLLQTRIGHMYETGAGTSSNNSEAVYWYRKAADQGNARAQSNLALMLAKGKGVPKDEREAVRWYRKAADQGDARAQNNLGIMYEHGRGVPKDEREAVRWYRKAADQGSALAQSNLALMLAKGKGVPKDEREAVRWYRKAADRGNAPAQNNLGIMYEHGRGVPKDEREAVRWYRKAADQGNAPAQNNLGIMYEHGRGVPKDEREAVRWYRKAADQGNASARKALARRGLESTAKIAAAKTNRPNSRDSLVLRIQSELAALGYSVGTADGIAGKQTRAAIRQFQARQGIPSDGEPSTGLLVKISRATPTPATKTPTASRHQATPGRRVALVVGNSRYQNTTRLENPKRDAEAVAAKLRKLGFEVLSYTDTESSQMRSVLRDFRKKLRGADLSLFYYAGHAVQVGGRNYLLPVDARIEEEADLSYDAVKLDSVMLEMERSSGTRILILDACRDNPFVKKLAAAMPRSRSASVSRGLAVSRRPVVGTLIAYATSPDNVAADGSTNHSPYTSALVKWIDRPGLEIGEVFRKVRAAVIESTNGQQIPWENSSLVGDGIYLAGDR